MTNDNDLQRACVSRRTFICRAAGTSLGLGLLTGCPRDQIKKGIVVAKFVVLRLPIPHTHKLVIGVGLQLASTALSCNFLWGTGGERRCEQASYTPTPEEQELITKKTPVVVQNTAGEALNDRVLIASPDMLTLKDAPKLFEIRYRCPNIHEDTVPTAKSRYIGAMLQMLGINWQGKDQGFGRTKMIYGATPHWQNWFTPVEKQARMWERELKRAKFDAEVRSVPA
jgi:hypothetical protein